MANIVCSDTTHIDTDLPFLKGKKVLFFPRLGIEYSQRHRSSGRSGEKGYDRQTGFFLQTAHEIHVLDGLTGSPLDQVVDRRDDDDPPGSLVYGDSDIAVVRTDNGGEIGKLAGPADPD
jgi:hypothetical protein